MNDDQHLHQLLIEAFTAESREIIQRLNDELHSPTVNFGEVSRLAHTLKGAARACGVARVEDAANTLEMYAKSPTPARSRSADLINTLREHVAAQHPNDDEPPQELPSDASRLTARNEQDIRVLIVDDSPTVRAHHRALFNQPGFRVVGEAVNGNEAWSFLTTDSVDVVVSDLEMPIANGIDLTRAIRSSTDSRVHALPIVMLTSRTEPEFRQAAVEAGVTRYLSKALLRTSDITDHVREVAET